MFTVQLKLCRKMFVAGKLVVDQSHH